VLGIAGPGDACHDWVKSKATLQAVAKAVPDLKLCLSTNGLALPDCLDDIAALRIDHVTITINMVNPEVGARIYPWVYFQGKRYHGLEASTILHRRQMEGLEGLVARGILVKVNSVMIPGINDVHLLDVNAVVKAKGAFLHNVMPLLSDPRHGTHFGLTGQRGPTPKELQALQERLGQGSKLMRHCRQCRADAVGLLGEDRGQEFELARLPEQVAYDSSLRDTHREVIARERSEHAETRQAAVAELASLEGAPPVLVAVATRGGGRINQHFGHASEFQVFEASPRGVRFIGHRKVDTYCQGGWGEDASLDATLQVLEGIGAVLCAKVGTCPKEGLAQAGIAVTDRFAYEWIEAGVAAWYASQAEPALAGQIA
jgi:nitrogen fixation protein NifB